MTETGAFTEQNPIRVFLLDDHEVVRRGLTDLLNAEPDISVVGDADTAEHADNRCLTRPQQANSCGRCVQSRPGHRRCRPS
jgi:hypothetical protein